MDVCLADTGYSMTEIPITAYHGTKIAPKRGDTTAPPSGIYPCKEGWVLVSAGDQHHWHRVCNALGRPDWLEDPRFNTRTSERPTGNWWTRPCGRSWRTRPWSRR